MNRGLYHRGFALQAGHTYAGYLYARAIANASMSSAAGDDAAADAPSSPRSLLSVRLEDAPSPLQFARPSRALASASLAVPADGAWHRLAFELSLDSAATASPAVACAPFPVGAPPLRCVTNSEASDMCLFYMPAQWDDAMFTVGSR